MLGDAWIDLGIIAGDAGVESVLCLAYLGDGIVIAGGSMSPPVPQFTRNRIFRSTDYGQTWTNLGQIANNAQTVYSLYNAGNGRVLAGFGLGATDPPHETGAQIWESTDWGQTWHVIIVFPLGNRTVQGIAKCSGNTWCACGIWQAGINVFGVIWRSLDNGATWPEQFNLDLGNQQAAFDVLYVGSQQVLTAAKGAGPNRSPIYKNNNNGADLFWNVVYNGPVGSVQARCLSAGEDEIVVAGRDACIVRSTNLGNGWVERGQVLPDATSDVWDISYFGAPSNLFLAFGSRGHVVRSTNDGLDWTDLGEMTTALGEGFYGSVNLENTLALVSSDIGHIYKSGEIWAKPKGIPDNLLCEQKKNPTDVTDPQPEFSAIHRWESEVIV